MRKLLQSVRSWLSLSKIIMLAGVILLVAAAGAWWKLVYSSPAHVFDRMLANSLSTSSFTKISNQDDDTQILDQKIQMTTLPARRVHAVNVLKQVADAGTVVTTESISSPAADFVRYTDIQTSQKNASGSKFDFSSVLRTWGKADAKDPQSGGAQLYNQTLLGVVPVANIPAADRKVFINSIKKSQVYKTNPAAAKREIVDGRPAYTYEVTVKPAAYVTMLKAFAKSQGLKNLENVDAEQYADSPALNFTFMVDVWSAQLTNIMFKDSKRSEAISAYGARLQIELPTSSIKLQELQTRLQQIR